MSDEAYIPGKNAHDVSGLTKDAGSGGLSPKEKLTCPKCGSHSITVVSGMGLRATCGQCLNIGGEHEFRATSPTGA